MGEEINIDEFLEYFREKNIPTIVRVLLSHDGTVQSLLSIIYSTPVKAVVVDQKEDESFIYRETSLRAGEKEVCHAVSKIPKGPNDSAVLAFVRAKELGLGQIAVALKISTARSIRKVGQDETGFYRSYVMYGKGIYFIITEHFSKETSG